MFCKDCEMWVEEDEVTLDPSHEEALRCNSGFCVLQDLYTDKKPDDECDDEESLSVWTGNKSGQPA